MRKTSRLGWLLGLVVLAGCDDGGGEDEDPSPAPVAGPTFHAQVAPILAARCGGCHVAGGIGPFAFADFEAVSPLAGLILDAVESGRMPPWGAQETDACKPRFGWKDDIRPTAEEIATLRAWYDAGAPEGDPATAPPPKASDLLTALPDLTREITPVGPFTAQGLADQFRCFVIDPGYAEETYINGVHFIPGNPNVVHHALLYLDRDGVSEGLKDGAPDGGYDCFGGPGFSGPELVAPWAPGGVPTQLPAGVGVPIPAGARFVLQIHYHPIGAESAPDLTRIQLRETNLSPEYFGLSILVGNFDSLDASGDGLQPDADGEVAFRIPAGAKAHVEEMRFTIPNDYEGRPSPGAFIYAVGTHMHYVGTDMRIEFERAERAPACTVEAIEPLLTCLGGNCPDMEGEALVDCAVDQCAAQLAPLQGPCLDCLGAKVGDPFGCTVAADYSHYGEIPEQPAEECLVETPQWDFEWQRWYVYDEPEITRLPFLAPGDVVKARCVYDNSLDNPFVRRAIRERGLDGPEDVVLGDETLDEMCLVVMELIYRWPD